MYNIELITCESGDWIVLKLNDIIYYQGHSIPDFIWIKLLKEFDIDVDRKEISDEEMENL